MCYYTVFSIVWIHPWQSGQIINSRIKSLWEKSRRFSLGERRNLYVSKERVQNVIEDDHKEQKHQLKGTVAVTLKQELGLWTELCLVMMISACSRSRRMRSLRKEQLRSSGHLTLEMGQTQDLLEIWCLIAGLGMSGDPGEGWLGIKSGVTFSAWYLHHPHQDSSREKNTDRLDG